MLKSGFQYISCYCLSCPKIVGDNVDLSFQYISCYCLSSVIQVDRFHASSFQYISCYCLSYLRHVYSHLSLNFNTSHVTVYLYLHILLTRPLVFQYISCYCLSISGFLNAISMIISIHLMLLFISRPPFIPAQHHRISIHLMLLFINDAINEVTTRLVFQYISCYCLSTA